MGITINGSSAAGNIDLGTNGTITDLAVGGLPDGTVDGDSLASTIPSSKLTGALPAISGASLTNLPTSPPAGRNKIINGEMKINQRGDETGVTSSGYRCCDRYQFKISNGGTWTIQQDSGPASEGFTKSLLYHCTSSGTMTGANHVYFRHKIEAQRLTDWKWGTAQATDVTLSFWVKSTETGTGTITCFHYDHDTSDANTGYTYTINAANTWEKKTITIAKSTDNPFDDNNGGGLVIYWNLDGGPDLKTGTANTSWGAWNQNKWMVGQTFAHATAGRKFWITGIQCEAGTTATDFEHLGYEEDMRRCKRYYIQYGGGGSGDRLLFEGYSGNTQYSITNHLSYTMRGAPSVSRTGTWGDNNVGSCAFDYRDENQLSHRLIVSSAGDAYTHTDADSYLILDAEI